MAMLSVLKDVNCDESGEPLRVDPKSGRPITPHGLRATFRTWGEDAGFPRDALEESLGHQIGAAVERAYRRPDSFDRRRAIMETWADFCRGKPRPHRSGCEASRTWVILSRHPLSAIGSPTRRTDISSKGLRF